MKAGAEDVLTQQTRFFGLGDRCAKALDRQRILRADVDVALVASCGATRNHHAFENCVGIALHDGLVHERAGVALVAVADDVLLALRHPADAFPLLAGREAGAASAAQTGVYNLGTDFGGRHVKERFFQGRIAVVCQIFIQVFRVGVAAGLENDALLLFIEGDIVVLDVGGVRELVQKALDDFAVEDGLFEDFLAVLRMDMGIENAFGLDLNQRSHLAEALTAAPLEVKRVLAALFAQRHTGLELPLLAKLLKLIINLHCAARDTAGTGADENHALLSGEPCLCLLTAGVQSLSRSDSHCAEPSFARISSSSATARSGSIFAWTSPSIVMTGASPHAPRHATVSSVNRPSSDVLRLPLRPR